MAEGRRTKDDPYTHAPEGWKTQGVPYGSWCRCHKCGLVSRSTFTFDYYASNVGDPLECESCKMGQVRAVAPIMDKVAEETLTEEGGR